MEVCGITQRYAVGKIKWLCIMSPVAELTAIMKIWYFRLIHLMSFGQSDEIEFNAIPRLWSALIWWTKARFSVRDGNITDEKCVVVASYRKPCFCSLVKRTLQPRSRIQFYFVWLSKLHEIDQTIDLRIDLHTPKTLIIQLHTSSVRKNACHTVFIQFQKKTSTIF